MSDLQFDEQNNFQFKSRAVLGDYRKPGMVDWLQRKGIVKSDRSAQYVLVGVIVVCLALAGGIFFYDDIFAPKPKKLSPVEIQQLPEPFREAYLRNQNEK